MRLKIIGGNLAVVLLMGLVSFLMVRGELQEGLSRKIESGIDEDQVLFDRSFRLSAIQFLEHVVAQSNTHDVRNVFSGLDEASRRNRAYEAAEQVVAYLGDPARGHRGQPDIVAIVDDRGSVVARNGGRNLMYGQSLVKPLPTLAKVLEDGEPRHDGWRQAQEKKVLQTGMAPIRGDRGAILGALVVGYDLSNGVAEREGGLLGREVAFVTNNQVYSSSLDENDRVRALHKQLFGELEPLTRRALQRETDASQVWRAELMGDEYVGVTAPLPMTPSLPIAYAVMGNRTDELQAASVANVILYMMVLGAVLVIAYGSVVGTSILRPIERIEEGVLAVINGNTDIRLETDNPEVGGLAYRINQLLNVFTGTEEQTEEDGRGLVSHRPDAGAWKDAAFSEVQQSASAGREAIEDTELAGRLASEDEESYYQRTYDEYVAAKQALGENVSNIPQERFVQRLKGNEANLVKKYGCRMVRFQVQTRDNQVILRPVVIR